jgi:hypothetical protein
VKLDCLKDGDEFKNVLEGSHEFLLNQRLRIPMSKDEEFGYNEAEALIQQWIFNKGFGEALVRAKREAIDTSAHLHDPVLKAKQDNKEYNEGRLQALTGTVSLLGSTSIRRRKHEQIHTVSWSRK